MNVLKNNPIFHSVELSVLNEFQHHVKAFDKGQVAYDQNHNEHCIMFLLEGQAIVEQVKDNIFLKRLHPGDVVGVLSIFSEQAFYPTKVTFEKNSQVLVLGEDEVIHLLYKDPTLLKNYMNFINGQVKYLLNRIELFSVPSGEERLIMYLKSLNDHEVYFELPMSKVELAEYLGMARSTLYRSFDKLIDTNVIEQCEHTYKIIGGKL